MNTYGPDARICWYRLEQEDRELAVFDTHFIEALFPNGEEKWCNSREIEHLSLATAACRRWN